MTTFDRRRFLSRSLAAAAGFAAAPTWLARAFGLGDASPAAQDPQPAADPVATWRKEQLTKAIATAKLHGKPLLVLVVPDDQPVVWDASHWFGAWLTHGDALARETFGLCTLACARVGEVEAMAGVHGEAVAKTTKMVTMLLVDATRAGQNVDKPVRATRIEPELPIVPPPSRMPGDDERPGDSDAAATRRKGLAAMTEALQAGLAQHGANLAELAKASSSTLDATQQQALAAWVKDGKPTPPELLVRGLAALRIDIAGLPETVRTARLAELSKVVLAVVVKQQIAGSRWRTRGVCVSQFESPTEVEKSVSVVPCGTAMVPPLCERFLDFYSVGG
jgi:hypothetical protein